MNLFKRILPDIVVIILFAVISFVYFFPAVTEGRVLSQHDAVAGIGAGEESKEYLERTGERTRWTNSIFGGMPTYQMAPSYNSTDMLKGMENLYHLSHIFFHHLTQNLFSNPFYLIKAYHLSYTLDVFLSFGLLT